MKTLLTLLIVCLCALSRAQTIAALPLLDFQECPDAAVYAAQLVHQPLRVLGAISTKVIVVWEVPELANGLRHDWGDENPLGPGFDDRTGTASALGEIFIDQTDPKSFIHKWGHLVWRLVLTDTERASWTKGEEDWANTYALCYPRPRITTMPIVKMIMMLGPSAP